MKKALPIVLTFVLLLTLAGCSGSNSNQPETTQSADNNETQEAYNISLGTYNPPVGPDGLSMERFKEYAEEKSNGRLKVDVYHNSQLGNTNAQIEGVMLGSQDAFLVSTELLAPWSPLFDASALFFQFKDGDHLVRFFESDFFAPALEELEKNNIILLNKEWNFVMGPHRVVVSRKPINSIEDFKGLRMRVPDTPLHHKAWQAVGASTFGIAYNEIYLSLQQGMFEAFEVPVSVVRENSYCEVAKYMTITDTYPQRYNIIFSKKKFNSLPEDLQNILYEAAYEAGELYSQLVRDKYNEDIAFLKEELGVTYNEEMDTQPFREILREVYKEMEAKGELKEGLLDAIKALE